LLGGGGTGGEGDKARENDEAAERFHRSGSVRGWRAEARRNSGALRFSTVGYEVELGTGRTDEGGGGGAVEAVADAEEFALALENRGEGAAGIGALGAAEGKRVVSVARGEGKRCNGRGRRSRLRRKRRSDLW
jgi:hypothetical protein